MLLKLVTTLTCGAIVFCLAQVLVQLVCNKLTLIRFKKRSRNLPIHPDANWLGSHAVNVIAGHRSCQKLQKYHEKLGKTIGWIMGQKFGASTVDLDLIKLFIKDEPNAHLDKVSLGLPAKEFENSILLAPASDWVNLRRAIAPALM